MYIMYVYNVCIYTYVDICMYIHTRTYVDKIACLTKKKQKKTGRAGKAQYMTFEKKRLFKKRNKMPSVVFVLYIVSNWPLEVPKTSEEEVKRNQESSEK